MDSIILVTGATGTVGAQVASQLLDAGARVRIAVPDPASERAAPLVARGAEAVRLDWDDAATYGPAFAGVRRALLLTPFVEHSAAYVERAVAAARSAGVQHLVRSSALGADPEAPGVGRDHGLGEAAVKGAGSGGRWCGRRSSPTTPSPTRR
ncbi:MAG: NmrA family NAD(P)-binding protein [Myxococcota bacterium]